MEKIKVLDLVKEGWLSDEKYNEFDYFTQETVDALVHQAWGFAMKLDVQSLKNNKELKKRFDNIKKR